MRFDLVDEVIERSGDRIVTAKLVTAAEEYLADHFPDFALLPGVLMLEAMVQAARRLIDLEAASADDARESRADAAAGAARPWVVAEVRQVRYGNMVRPGQRLVVTVQRLKREADRQTFQGTGEVDGEVAVQGRFVLRPLAAPDASPDPRRAQG